MTVLRASSLAAVTIFVWSTRLKPAATAHSRTAWRTATTSSVARIGRRSVRTPAIAMPIDRGAQELHAALDVQRGLYTRQGEPQLDQRDRDRRAHAHDDRRGVEHPGHRGNVRQHAADEGIDH